MPAPITNRLFFALSPDADVSARVAVEAAALRRRHSFGGRLVKPERYHMTLNFLGDNVTPAGEAAAMEAAARIEVPPFRLQLDLASCFSNNRDMPVWLGTREPPAELVYLDEMLRRALGEKPRKRKLSFVPHLTIARNAVPLPTVPIAPIAWLVEGFILIRSLLTQKAHYEVLQDYPLLGGALPTEPHQHELL